MKMEKLKRSLSFRKKKDSVPECSKPHQWLEDERKVREGTCSFQVRYLGCIEVYESRGMQVCEEAVKSLKNQCKGKYQRAILYVSGDALRVVDEISKSMIVDQTIEKVSFCAPDRNDDKGFAYICRDGTTRRWICHGFMAIKESVSEKSDLIARFFRLKNKGGERLSHAVGCAFAICLERKQKRDKESGVNVTYNQDRTSFTRTGSFRQASITERIADPQSAILAGNTPNDPIPVKKVDNPYAVQRPHATQSLLQRQGSFRGFEKLHETSSPFKRSVSLRLSDLPSNLKRQNAVLESPPNVGGSPIPELSPTEENPDSVAQMCQQLSQGLRALNTDDPFASMPHTTLQSLHCPAAGAINTGASFHQSPTHLYSNQTHHQGYSGKVNELKSSEVNNPWGGSHTWAAAGAVAPPPSTSTSSSYTNPFLSNNSSMNGVPFPPKDRLQACTSTSSSTSSQLVTPRAPQLVQLRSHSIDGGDMVTAGRQQALKPTLQELANQQRNFRHNNGNVGNGWGASADVSSSKSASLSSSSVIPPPPLSSKTGLSSTLSALSSSGTTSSKVGSKESGPHVDPFDVAWASKVASLHTSNPFQGSDATQPSAQTAPQVVKTFQVQL